MRAHACPPRLDRGTKRVARCCHKVVIGLPRWNRRIRVEVMSLSCGVVQAAPIESPEFEACQFLCWKGMAARCPSREKAASARVKENAT